MSIPWWESGTVSEANDASEKATNLKWSSGIGCIFTVTEANIFASWRIFVCFNEGTNRALIDLRLEPCELTAQIWTSIYSSIL